MSGGSRPRVRLRRGLPLRSERPVKVSSSGYWKVRCEPLPGLIIHGHKRAGSARIWRFLTVVGDANPRCEVTYEFLSRHQLTDARFPTRRAAVGALEVALDVEGLLR